MSIALTARAGHLPNELTSFVARRAESAEIQRLLGSARVVSLIGPGGVGKTRLALRAGADRRRAFPDGVSFVELSVLDEPELLVDTVAGALEVAAVAGEPSVVAIVEHFRRQHALLILDNCEHLLDPTAELVATLLQGCPDLTILLTSRAPLRIFGESVLAVPPMAVPADGPPEVGSPYAVESVRLFVNRATEACPDFEPDEADLVLIGELCRRLDGLPLAIELAAVRLRVLSLGQIIERLDDRYRLLTGGLRCGVGRHRTLRAAIEWSYELCAPPERLLWARLAVFSGSWELDAAEAVCSGDGVDRADVLDGLQALVDQSVVIREGDGSGPATYRMLATIREFGTGLLVESGQLVALRRRHRDWLRTLLARADAEWIGPDQAEWLARTRRERPDIRAALEFCLGRTGEQSLALELTVPGWRAAWWAQGRVDELHHWLERILAQVEPTAPLVPRAIAIRTLMAAIQRRAEVGVADVVQARADAVAAGDASTVALTWYVEAFVLMTDRQIGAAAQRLEQAVVALGDRPDPGTRMLVVTTLAMALAQDGPGDRTRGPVWEAAARELAGERGERFELSYLLRNLGWYAWNQGELARAEALVGESVRLKRELGDLTGLAVAAQTLAGIAADSGDAQRAATLLGAAAVLWAACGGSPASYPQVAGQVERSAAQVADALGSVGYDRARAVGQRMSIEQAVAFALGEIAAVAPADQPAASVLTAREREIAELVADGLTNRQIAAQLVIAQRTAEGHVERILTKLGFGSRTQIVAWLHERTR